VNRLTRWTPLVLLLGASACTKSERCVVLSDLGLSALCPSSGTFPGSALMGDFVFTGTLVASDCPFSDSSDVIPDAGCLPGGPSATADAGCAPSLSFEGTFSYDPNTGQTWLTLGGKQQPCACASPPLSWNAVFDGQNVSAASTAPRSFVECGESPVAVQETLTVALLSQSQAAAVGGQCPANPLDGGVPVPADGGVSADGGTAIRLPGPIAGGFDARLACGVLVDQVIPGSDAGATCPACRWMYVVGGTLQ
jgi:hypothetical protein